MDTALPPGALVSHDEGIEEYVLVEPKDLRSVAQLQAFLEPTDYLSPGNEYMKHLHSYVSGTGEWLRSLTVYQQWISRTDDATHRSNCMWVKGVPGSGKSVFSASLAKHLHQDGHPVLFFFFRQIVATNHDPKYLVRDWLAQLLPHSQWLHHKLDELSKTKTQSSKDHSQLWTLLVQALQRMEKLVYCIADGLDEMDDAYADFIDKLKDLGMHDQVRVLLTSRPIPRIEEKLRDRSVLSIKLDPSLLYPDITHYVEVRLNTLDPKLSSAKYEEVKEAICERAKGLFLHARLMTDNLTNGLREGSIVEATLPTSLERLPRNLKELYTQMLNEHSQRSGITQEQQFMVLQCVVHSSRPLRLIELGSLITVLRQDSDMSLKEGKDLVRSSCGRLLEILEDESVSVIHHSFTEFLRDVSRIGEKDAFPVLDKEKAHLMLADISLKYLDKCDVPPNALYDVTIAPEDRDPFGRDKLDWPDIRDDEDRRRESLRQALRSTYPLLSYVVHNLDHHVSKISSGDTGIFLALDSLFQPGKPAFTLWLLMQWESYRMANVSTLHVASWLGWYDYIEHCISNGIDIDHRDAEESTPLSYAAIQGHTNVISLLFRHGADPNSDDRDGHLPLHHAVLKNRLETVKTLLVQGTSPTMGKTKNTPEYAADSIHDVGVTPMEYACRHQHTDIIEVFLPLLDETWKQKVFRWAYYPQDIELVLQTGQVAVDEIAETGRTFSDEGCTKLYQAARDHNVAVVELLLRYGADPNFRSAVKREGLWKQWPPADGKTYSDGPTALHGVVGYTSTHALLDGIDNGVKCFELLRQAGADIHAEDGDGVSLLHCACVSIRIDLFGDEEEFSQIELVRALLDAGAAPNKQTRGGMTPLHFANDPSVIDLLVKYGADPTIQDEKGLTPLLKSLSTAQIQKSEVIEKLLEIDAQQAHQTQHRASSMPLHWLMGSLPRLADPKLFQMVLRAGVDVNARNDQGKPPLLAIKGDRYYQQWSKNEMNTRRSFELLRNAGMDMNSTDPAGHTVLHSLVIRYDTELDTLKLFIELGCDPHIRDNQGHTILHHALSRSLDIVDFFLHLGVDPQTVDYEQNTLVHEFVKKYSTELSRSNLQMLQRLQKLGIPMDSKNGLGQTPLHLLCAKPGSGKGPLLIEAFLDGKIVPPSDINAEDNKGARPIHYAAITCEAYVRRLLNSGATAEVLTYEGLSPLHLAARAHQPNIVGLLLEEYQKRGVLDHYVKLQSPIYPRGTALHYACISGTPGSVHYLCQAGADPNALDGRSYTPLHALSQPMEDVQWGGRNITRTISCPSGPPRGDRGGGCFKTSKTRAVDIIELLARAGAELDHNSDTNGHNVTPIDLAVENGCTEIVNELNKRGLHAQNLFAESIIGACRGSKEAELLLQIPEPPGERTKDHYFSMTPSEKINSVLNIPDYDLLREVVSQSAELRTDALRLLVRRGCAFLLEELLEESDCIEAAPEEGEKYPPETLLGIACYSGSPNLETIKLLVERGRANIDTQFGWQGMTALTILAKGQCFWEIQALEYLVEHGADVNKQNKDGMTPLMIAASSAYGCWGERILSILLEAGADPNKVNQVNRQGRTALGYAKTAESIRVLIAHGGDPTCAMLAAIEGLEVDCLEALLAAGADPNVPIAIEQGSPIFRFAIHEAAERFGQYDTEIDIQKTQQMITMLLEHGADPMAIYKDGATVVQNIIEEHGSMESILGSEKMMVDKKGKGGRSPLISSCYPTNIEIKYRTGPKEPAKVSSHTAMTLIAKGAIIRAIDDQGRSALHWLCTLPTEFDDAARKVFTEITTRAPELIHLRDNNGWRPFDLAVRADQTWAADAMLDLGVDVLLADPDGNTALHVFASKVFSPREQAAKSLDRLKHFLSRGLPINHRNKDGMTPLALFIAHIDHGFNSDRYDAHAVHFSFFSEAGADFFTVNDNGEGLLHLTAARTYGRYGHDHSKEIAATFKELMDMGLDPRMEDGACRTAIDVAVARETQDIVYLFQEAK